MPEIRSPDLIKKAVENHCRILNREAVRSEQQGDSGSSVSPACGVQTGSILPRGEVPLPGKALRTGEEELGTKGIIKACEV